MAHFPRGPVLESPLELSETKSPQPSEREAHDRPTPTIWATIPGQKAHFIVFWTMGESSSGKHSVLTSSGPGHTRTNRVHTLCGMGEVHQEKEAFDKA